jgi:nucleotide-binding universal stress UspA family protein
MFPHILIAEDDSTRTSTLLAVAYALGHRFSANLTLLHVAPDHTTPAEVARRYAALRRQKAILQASGIAATARIEFGKAADVIRQEAEEQRCNLIATFPRRRVHLNTFLLPSLTTQLLSHPQIPLFIWPELEQQDQQDKQDEHDLRETDGKLTEEASALHEIAAFFEHRGAPIIVPLDGSDLANHALPIACSWARILGRSMLLLRVVPRVALPGGGPQIYVWGREAEQQDARDAKEWLDNMREELLSAPENAAIPHIGTVVKIGVASEHMLYLAANTPDALIVMSTHGRGGLARLVVGSVTNMVVHHTTAPTLVIPPQADAFLQLPYSGEQHREVQSPLTPAHSHS